MKPHPLERSKFLRRRVLTSISGEDPNAYGPIESRGTFWQRVSFKESLTLMWRPYKFLLTEPIVLFLSLLSGFSDALIFTGLDSFPLVLAKWNFSTIQVGLAFILPQNAQSMNDEIFLRPSNYQLLAREHWLTSGPGPLEAETVLAQAFVSASGKLP